MASAQRCFFAPVVVLSKLVEKGKKRGKVVCRKTGKTRDEIRLLRKGNGEAKLKKAAIVKGIHSCTPFFFAH